MQEEQPYAERSLTPSQHVDGEISPISPSWLVVQSTKSTSEDPKVVTHCIEKDAEHRTDRPRHISLREASSASTRVSRGELLRSLVATDSMGSQQRPLFQLTEELQVIEPDLSDVVTTDSSRSVIGDDGSETTNASRLFREVLRDLETYQNRNERSRVGVEMSMSDVGEALMMLEKSSLDALGTALSDNQSYGGLYDEVTELSSVLSSVGSSPDEAGLASLMTRFYGFLAKPSAQTIRPVIRVMKKWFSDTIRILHQHAKHRVPVLMLALAAALVLSAVAETRIRIFQSLLGGPSEALNEELLNRIFETVSTKVVRKGIGLM